MTTYYRATITIYVPFDPATVELDALAREATDGAAICTSMQVAPIANTDDLPSDAASFFAYGEFE